MALPYTIRNSDNTLIITIPEGVVDESSLSLSLVGRNVSNYGPYFARNVLRQLENFASATSPNYPITGQLWYDKANEVLKVYTGSAWSKMLELEGLNLGDLSTAVEGTVLTYTGSNWIPGSGGVGFTGSVGTGYTGSAGTLGYAGSQGSVGYTGSAGGGGGGGDGYTGSQGTVGYTGSRGYTGSQGTLGYTGSAGSGGAGLQYRFSDTLYVDNSSGRPGLGNTRFNSATVSSVSLIAIDNTTLPGVPVGAYWITLDDSTSTVKGYLIITTAGSNDPLVFTVDSLTNYTGTGWTELAVSYLNGSLPADGSTINIEFSRTGDAGSLGYTGSRGYTGSIGYTGSGTVISVDSGDGLTGGPVTVTGTLTVGQGTGITVNTDNVAINTSWLSGYVGSSISSNELTPHAVARIANDATVSYSYGITSATVLADEFTITLSTAVASTTSMVCLVTPQYPSGTPGYSAAYRPLSNTTVEVTVVQNGTNPSPDARSFSIVIYDITT